MSRNPQVHTKPTRANYIKSAIRPIWFLGVVIGTLMGCDHHSERANRKGRPPEKIHAELTNRPSESTATSNQQSKQVLSDLVSEIQHDGPGGMTRRRLSRLITEDSHFWKAFLIGEVDTVHYDAELISMLKVALAIEYIRLFPADSLAIVNALPSEIREFVDRKRLASLASTDWEGAANEVDSRYEGERRFLIYQELIEGQAKEGNVTAAMEIFNRMPIGRAKGEAAAGLARILVGKLEPEALVQWAESLDYPDLRERALRSIGQGFEGQFTSEQSKALLDTIDAPSVRLGLLSNLVYTSPDLKELFGWSESAGLADEERLIFQKNILYQMAQTDIATAATQLSTLSSDALKQFGISEVARNFSRTPSLGVEWLTGIADANDQHLATTTFVDGWVTQDSIAASQWAADLRPGAIRDSASFAIARYLATKSDYSSAEGWLENIDNQELRQEARQLLPHAE